MNGTIKSAVFLSRREKGGTEGLHSRSSNERPGRPCQLAALSGRRAAQDGCGRVLGGPERAGMEDLGEVLSAGRAAAPGQFPRETLGRGRSADRVAHALAERAKPGGPCGHGEAARASARARRFQAMARAVFFAIAAVGLFVGPASAVDPIPVKPGDIVTLPTPIKNADDQDNPGGDTISSMKLIVTGDPACVTNAVASADQSLAPGEEKTFTPSFVVGPAEDGQICTVVLHMVSPDAGIDPDPDDAASDTSVLFTVARPPTITATDISGRDIDDGATTASPLVKINVFSGGTAGLSEIYFPGFGPYPLKDVMEDHVTFQVVNPGINMVSVVDIAGNETSTSFDFKNVKPVLTLTGRNVSLQNIIGDQTTNPSEMVPSTITASAVDPTGQGFTAVQITGTGEVDCAPALPVPSGTTSVSCTIIMTAPGQHKFTVSNALGGSSIIWRGTRLTATIAPTVTGAFQGAAFHAAVELAVNSDLGIDNIQSYEVSSPSQIDRRAGTSFGDLPDMTMLSTVPYQRNYMITDVEGNQTFMSTRLELGWRLVGGDSNLSALTESGELSPGLYTTYGPDTNVDLTEEMSWNGLKQDLADALIIGNMTDSRTGQLYPNMEGGTGGYQTGQYDGVVSVPANNVPVLQSGQIQEQGSITVYADSGSNEFTIFQVQASYECGGVGGRLTFTPVDQIRAVGRNVRLRFVSSILQPSGVCSSRCNEYDPNGTTCIRGFSTFPNVGAPALTMGIMLSTSSAGASGGGGLQIWPGSNQTLTPGPNVSVSGLNAIGAGTIRVDFDQATQTPLGWIDSNSSLSYNLVMSTYQFWSGPFTITLPTAGGVPPGYDASQVKALFFPTDQGSEGSVRTHEYEVLPASLGGDQISVQVNGPGRIQIVTSVFKSPVSVTHNGLTVVSEPPAATLADVFSDARSAQALNVLASQGLALVGQATVAGPSGRGFNPPALVSYAPPQTQSGAHLAQVTLADAIQTALAGAEYDPYSNTYAGYVSAFHSLFGVFVPAAPVPAVDLLPPQTGLSLGTLIVEGSTETAISTLSHVGFVPVDGVYPGAPTSGIAQT